MKNTRYPFLVTALFFLLVGFVSQLEAQINIISISPNPVCEGGIITLSGGGFTVSGTNPDTIEVIKGASVNLLPTLGGSTSVSLVTMVGSLTGMVTIRVKNGASRDSIPLVIQPQLSIDFTPSSNSICLGNPVSFTPNVGGGTMNKTLLWKFGDGTTSTATNPTHTYSTLGTKSVVLIVTFQACTDSTTNTVTVNTGPTANISPTGPQTPCNVSSFTFTVTTNAANSSYVWNRNGNPINNATSSSYMTTLNGEYAVIVTDGLTGCSSSSDTVDLNFINPSISSGTFAIPTTLCENVAGNFAADPNLGASIAWDFGDGNMGTGNSTTHAYAMAGSYTVTAVAVQQNCTSTVETGVVQVDAIPIAQIDIAPTELCVDDSANFSASSSGGTATYKWDFGDGTMLTGQTVSHAYMGVGTFTISVRSTENNCESVDVTQTITINALPTADAGPDQTICVGDPFDVQIGGNPSASNGTSPYTYTWTPAAGLNDVSDPNPIASPTTTTLYSMEVTDVKGCKASDDVEVEAIPMPAFDLNSFMVTSPTTCDSTAPDGQIMASAIGPNPLEYQLMDANGILISWQSNTSTFSNLNSGMYTIQVRYQSLDDGRCVIDTTVTLLSPDAPIEVIMGPTELCGGDTATFAAEGEMMGVSFFWDFGLGATPPNETGPGPHEVFYNSSGTKNVTLRATREGCEQIVLHTVEAFAENEIFVENIPIASIPSFMAFNENPFKLDLSGSLPGTMFSWTAVVDSGSVKDFAGTGSGPSVEDIFELDNGDAAVLVYSVTAEVSGCVTEGAFFVNIKQPFFIPNLVTPNSDGLNDNWGIKINDLDNLDPNEFTVQVYNRSGARVYESKLAEVSWAGEGCPDGTYWYILSDDTNNQSYKGFVTLLRE